MLHPWRVWLHSSAAQSVARGLALFVSGLGLLGLVGKLRAPGFDANLWWVDLRGLPAWVADSAIGVLCVLLLAWAWRGQGGRLFRRGLQAALGVFVVVLLLNAGTFWRLVAEDRIRAGIPLPLSLLCAAGLGFIALQVRSGSAEVHRRLQLMACAACVLLFPLLQVVGFGKTDYRRPAAAAVVFGARAYADGRPSEALADRVRTACQLYQQGFVNQLIFSGGPGDGAIHETESMRRMAVRLGVPDAAILLDDAGLNTAATVRHVQPMVAGRPVIMVSEFYHLPRIKLACERAGLQARTVPARPTHAARAWPLKSMAREIPAFWLYYARAVFAGF